MTVRHRFRPTFDIITFSILLISLSLYQAGGDYQMSLIVDARAAKSKFVAHYMF